MTYENLVAQRAESKAGWGVFAASTFNVTSKLNFYGQATYGRGISQFLNDISNLDVDLVPDPEAKGKMQVLPMMVGMLACSIISRRRYSSPVPIARLVYTARMITRLLRRINTATVNTW